MTSILTNAGAIVALQTLKSVNMHMDMTQKEVSTGKRVNTAADGSAVWAVAKIMDSDQKSYNAIQSGLNVAGKVVSTAVEGADRITDNLRQIKTLLISSSNPDNNAKLNLDEIKELVGQIGFEINSRQVNGVNLLRTGGAGSAGATAYKVLASLDRSYGEAETTTSTIDVTSEDFTANVLKVLDNIFVDKDATYDATGQRTASTALGEGKVYGFDHSAAEKTAITTTKTAWDTAVATNTATPNATNATAVDTAKTAYDAALNAEKTTAAEIDFTHEAALGLFKSIDKLIDVSVKSAAQLGAKQSRIEQQADTVGKLADALDIGIGALVDTDLEEASARLKALQTQQQLGIQSLSIANQAPGAVLALFR